MPWSFDLSFLPMTNVENQAPPPYPGTNEEAPTAPPARFGSITTASGDIDLEAIHEILSRGLPPPPPVPRPHLGRACCMIFVYFFMSIVILGLYALLLSFIFTLFDEDNTKALVTLGIIFVLNIIKGVFNYTRLEYASFIHSVQIVVYTCIQIVCLGFIIYPHSTTAMYIFALLNAYVPLTFEKEK